MKNLAKYINALEYDYVITYSGFRGGKYQELVDLYEQRLQEAENKIPSARYMDKIKLRKEIDKLNSELDLHNTRLINKEGDLHPSIGVNSRLAKNEAPLISILEIFKRRAFTDVAAMCAPIFRDAIVFYSKENTVKGILHICFECLHIQDEEGGNYIVNSEMYRNLAQVLSKLGHPIESEIW